MKFENALYDMRHGKVVTDGIHEFRITQIFQTRLIGDPQWQNSDSVNADEIMSDHWEVVDKEEIG